MGRPSLVFFILLCLQFSIKPEENEFVRIHENYFQSGIFILDSPSYPALIVMVGTVHMGDESYYVEINDILNACDVVFYEDIQPSNKLEKDKLLYNSIRYSNMISLEGDLGITTKLQIEYAKALGLQYQGDHIYPRQNWVNADISLEEFNQMLKEFKGKNLSLDKKYIDGDTIDINEILQNKDKEPRKIMEYRRQIAEEIIVQARVIYTEEDLKPIYELFIEKRNQAAIRKITPYINDNKVIGMIYGAAHIPDFLKHFFTKWNYRIIRKKWMNAWLIR